MTVDRDEDAPARAQGAPRHEALPETKPKHPAEDPEAPARVRRILEHPAYVRADHDPQFLQRDELRGTRLQLEFLKPELTLTEHEVASTIVLFGGTRIVEPAAAQRSLDEWEQICKGDPSDRIAARKRDIAQRILAKSKYYEVARDFARLVSERCRAQPHEFVITTGGGPGIMEAGNRGAYEVGAKSVGLNITLPMEQYPNPYITPELCFRFRYFGLRKLHFMKRAKALVAFPGGYGTMDELFDGLSLVQTRKIAPMPIILVGREFWNSAIRPQFMADEGVIADEDVALCSYAETAEEIWEIIRSFYQM
jgi:uncharacterized protein (TIGR00730 family)